jgi:D,D-heptose 1,7-bisphosphate phosphatase
MAEAFPGLCKPMIPIDGKPVIERLIETYSRQGIKRFLITIGHLGHQIRDHLGDGGRYGVSIDYFEETRPLGTAGAFPALKSWINEPSFFVLYADTVGDVDLARMSAFHLVTGADATILVHPNDHPYDSDLIELTSDDRVAVVHAKPHPGELEVRNLVNGALYLVNLSVLPLIPDGEAVDFGRDLLPVWAKQLRIYGYRSPEYLKDMGSPRRRAEVEAAVRSGKVSRRNMTNRQIAVFLDRDGVINEHNGLVANPAELKLIPGAADAIHRLNCSDLLTVVVSNQSVVARGLTDEQGVERIHARMERMLAEESGAFLDDILFCPHHPDGGYPEENPRYKMVCDCRKPGAGMLLAAARRFNIDLSSSVMIGDSVSDIQAGIAAGVRLCIKIGAKWSEDKKSAVGVVSVACLADAVDWLLSEGLHRQVRA